MNECTLPLSPPKGGKCLHRDNNHDSHSRRGSGRGLYANEDQSPLSGRGHVTPVDQSGRTL